MSKFAIIRDNIVWNCVVAENVSAVELVMAGINESYDNIVEMTEDTKFAGKGYEYYNGKFRRQKPSNAYKWNESAWSWMPIAPMPDGPEPYIWNPVTESWQVLEVVTPSEENLPI